MRSLIDMIEGQLLTGLGQTRTLDPVILRHHAPDIVDLGVAWKVRRSPSGELPANREAAAIEMITYFVELYPDAAGRLALKIALGVAPFEQNSYPDRYKHYENERKTDPSL